MDPLMSWNKSFTRNPAITWILMEASFIFIEIIKDFERLVPLSTLATIINGKNNRVSCFKRDIVVVLCYFILLFLSLISIETCSDEAKTLEFIKGPKVN